MRPAWRTRAPRTSSAEGQTLEDVAQYFIEITKAYKALTDEVVRKNYEEYGHPDGKQSVEFGLALPKWVVDAHNNIWVLGAYALVIGGLLPYLVVSCCMVRNKMLIAISISRENGGSAHAQGQRMVYNQTLRQFSSKKYPFLSCKMEYNKPKVIQLQRQVTKEICREVPRRDRRMSTLSLCRSAHSIRARGL